MTARAAVVGLAAAAACGRLGFAGRDAGAVPDAAPTLACDWSGEPALLAPPTRLGGLSGPGYEADPTLSPDERTLYFALDGQIWKATRADRASPFGAPVLADEVAAVPGDLSGLAVDRDGLGAIVAADPTTDSDLLRLVRATPTAPFTAGTPIPELSTAGHEYNGRLSPDGLAIVFVRWLVPGDATSSDVFVAHRPSRTEAWGAIGATNFSQPGRIEAGSTFVGDARLVLATVDDDLALVRRAAVDAPFEPPEVVAGLSSPSFEGLPWVSADGCEVLFVSSRDTPDGNWNLYRAELAPP